MDILRAVHFFEICAEIFWGQFPQSKYLIYLSIEIEE